MRRVRALARRFAFAHVGGTALVLIYHRVADLESDPQLLAVSRANFESQMALLADRYHPQSLSDLAEGLRANRVRDRAVVVTFDDGYADNLTNAAPVLDAHGIPATVFVSSGFLGGHREFWWDELEALVLQSEQLPERIAIELAGAPGLEVCIESDAGQSGETPTDRDWNVLAPDTLPRHGLYRTLHAFLRPLSVRDRAAALEQLRDQLRATHLPRSTHRQLTTEQVAELDAYDTIEVGAHTVNHALLSALDLAEQGDEIIDDRDALAAICRRQIRAFSYPYGAVEDYTSETVALVRAAGFDAACSNHVGVVKPWTDPLRIPRLVVRDWTRERFERELVSWYDDPR